VATTISKDSGNRTKNTPGITGSKIKLNKDESTVFDIKEKKEEVNSFKPRTQAI